jgi:hypothetical protein
MKIEINLPSIRLPKFRAKKKEGDAQGSGRLSRLRRPEYDDVIDAAGNTLALIAVILLFASVYVIFTLYGEYNDNQAVFSQMSVKYGMLTCAKVDADPRPVFRCFSKDMRCSIYPPLINNTISNVTCENMRT